MNAENQTAPRKSELPWERPENTLEFGVIKDDFDQLLKATENKIEREWPSRLGGGSHSLPFLFMVKLARWSYVATLYLLADQPPDPKRHLEYAVVVPPVNRTILDSLFNVIFIFDHYPDRLCWYLQSGFEEVQRKLGRFERAYSGDLAWQDWLRNAKASLNPFARSRDEVCSGKAPNTKGRFPHPGRMLCRDVHFSRPELRDFLLYLNEWFYGDLSSSAHAHWSGLTERILQILRLESKDELQHKLSRKFKSDSVMQQMTLTLALASEVIAFASFDNKGKAAYVWGILAAYWGEAKDLFSKRYAKLLE